MFLYHSFQLNTTGTQSKAFVLVAYALKDFFLDMPISEEVGLQLIFSMKAYSTVGLKLIWSVVWV